MYSPDFNLDWVKTIENRRFVCDICKNTYNIRSSLVRHNSEKHLDNLNWYCNLCGDKFVRKADITRHSERNHEGMLVKAVEKTPKNTPRKHESRQKAKVEAQGNRPIEGKQVYNNKEVNNNNS
jgi:hypothetical protein